MQQLLKQVRRNIKQAASTGEAPATMWAANQCMPIMHFGSRIEHQLFALLIPALVQMGNQQRMFSSKRRWKRSFISTVRTPQHSKNEAQTAMFQTQRTDLLISHLQNKGSSRQGFQAASSKRRNAGNKRQRLLSPHPLPHHLREHLLPALTQLLIAHHSPALLKIRACSNQPLRLLLHQTQSRPARLLHQLQISAHLSNSKQKLQKTWATPITRQGNMKLRCYPMAKQLSCAQKRQRTMATEQQQR